MPEEALQRSAIIDDVTESRSSTSPMSTRVGSSAAEPRSDTSRRPSSRRARVTAADLGSRSAPARSTSPPVRGQSTSTFPARAVTIAPISPGSDGASLPSHTVLTSTSGPSSRRRPTARRGTSSRSSTTTTVCCCRTRPARVSFACSCRAVIIWSMRSMSTRADSAPTATAGRDRPPVWGSERTHSQPLSSASRTMICRSRGLWSTASWAMSQRPVSATSTAWPTRPIAPTSGRSMVTGTAGATPYVSRRASTRRSWAGSPSEGTAILLTDGRSAQPTRTRAKSASARRRSHSVVRGRHARATISAGSGLRSHRVVASSGMPSLSVDVASARARSKRRCFSARS